MLSSSILTFSSLDTYLLNVINFAIVKTILVREVKKIMRRLMLIILSVLLLILPCGCTASNPNCYFSKNVQAESILISQKVFSEGCENVVITSASEGNAIWYGTAFAGAIDAPVLIFRSKTGIDKEIKRLNAKNVYIFGDFKYTPPKSVSCVRFSSDEAASLQAAVYLRDTLKINCTSAFLVSCYDEAAAIASQAYKLKAPILFTQKDSVSDDILPLVSQSEIYVVGSGYSNAFFNKLGNDVNYICGASIEELSGYANLILDKDTASLTAVNNPIDITYASAFAKYNNSAVIYYADRLFATQEKFISEKNTDIIYSIGTLREVDMSPSIKSDMSKASKRIFSFDSNFQKAIFYVPHQDDETIFCSQAILEAINAYGADNVTVVLFTDGAASQVKNGGKVGQCLDSLIQSVQERTESLSDDESDSLRTALFSHSRDNEILGALAELGVKNENIRFIGLGDGHLKNSLEQVEAVMSEYKDIPDTLHFTFSPYYDTHPDHRALGRGLLNVLGENAENAYFFVRFDNDMSFFEESELYDAYSSVIFEQPDLNKLALAINEYGIESCDTETISSELASNLSNGQDVKLAVKNAKSAEQLRMAVGFNSVIDLFSSVKTKVNHSAVITIMHKPFIKPES